MIGDILILRTEQKEIERENLLNKTYDVFVNKLGNSEAETINNKYLFLSIDLRDKNYGKNSQYLVDVNTDPEVNKYGVSCTDIRERINKLMIQHKQSYKCTYNINWYCGSGLFGFWKKIKCEYPYIKSVHFLLTKVNYSMNTIKDYDNYSNTNTNTNSDYNISSANSSNSE